MQLTHRVLLLFLSAGGLALIGLLFIKRYRRITYMSNIKKTLNIHFLLKIIPENEGIYEFEWITSTLLGRIGRPLRILGLNNKTVDDTLSVFMFDLLPFPTYFADLRNAGLKNQGILHMGDEHHKNDLTIYPYFNYVMRNYYNRNILKRHKNVIYVPIGTKSGYGWIADAVQLPSTKRSIMCNFIGSLRSHRAEMIMLFNSSSLQCYLKADINWNDRFGLPTIEYKNVLRESVFTLAPWGNNPETFRLFEALEAGSIPITLYNESLSGSFSSGGLVSPIPLFGNWRDAISFIAELRKKPEQLDALQEDIRSFWRKYKRSLQMKLKDTIDRSFFNTYGTWC